MKKKEKLKSINVPQPNSTVTRRLENLPQTNIVLAPSIKSLTLAELELKKAVDPRSGGSPGTLDRIVSTGYLHGYPGSDEAEFCKIGGLWGNKEIQDSEYDCVAGKMNWTREE